LIAEAAASRRPELETRRRGLDEGDNLRRGDVGEGESAEERARRAGEGGADLVESRAQGEPAGGAIVRVASLFAKRAPNPERATKRAIASARGW
jgi:hypothetical protein